jgi:hypothetical protein
MGVAFKRCGLDGLPIDPSHTPPRTTGRSARRGVDRAVGSVVHDEEENRGGDADRANPPDDIDFFRGLLHGPSPAPYSCSIVPEIGISQQAP